MLLFDDQNPFPLLPENSYSYEDSKKHAAQVDLWLGLHAEYVEQKIMLNKKYAQEKYQSSMMPEYWSGLAVQTLQTPYTEIREIIERLAPKPGQTIVDLGSGYGRMGHVIGKHYPHVNFVGYEYVEERVQESQRCLGIHYYPNVSIKREDLSSAEFRPMVADYYFMYDFGSRPAIEKTLADLQNIAINQKITVVGRGRNTRDTIERRHPWLGEVNAPEHRPQYSIYRS